MWIFLHWFWFPKKTLHGNIFILLRLFKKYYLSLPLCSFDVPIPRGQPASLTRSQPTPHPVQVHEAGPAVTSRERCCSAQAQPSTFYAKRLIQFFDVSQTRFLLCKMEMITLGLRDVWAASDMPCPGLSSYSVPSDNHDYFLKVQIEAYFTILLQRIWKCHKSRQSGIMSSQPQP